MSAEDVATDVPTRAVHEAYLDMQRALKRHRQVSDSGNQAAVEDAHGDVQETVLTFYELLRPHLKQTTGVEGYWHGAPPPYTENGNPPDPDDGKGVLHVQRRRQQFQLNGSNPDDLETLKDWHRELDLATTVRLVGIQQNGDGGLVHYDAYQLGLRTLDEWRTRFDEQETDVGGFMGGKSETEKRRQRVPMPKLRRAARQLGEVASKMKLLSHVETDNKQFIRDFDQSRDEESAYLDQTEYGGEPPL